jgi:hypothetical protein
MQKQSRSFVPLCEISTILPKAIQDVQRVSLDAGHDDAMAIDVDGNRDREAVIVECLHVRELLQRREAGKVQPSRERDSAGQLLLKKQQRLRNEAGHGMSMCVCVRVCVIVLLIRRADGFGGGCH